MQHLLDALLGWLAVKFEHSYGRSTLSASCFPSADADGLMVGWTDGEHQPLRNNSLGYSAEWKTVVIMNADHGERRRKQRDVIDNKPQRNKVMASERAWACTHGRRCSWFSITMAPLLKQPIQWNIDILKFYGIFHRSTISVFSCVSVFFWKKKKLSKPPKHYLCRWGELLKFSRGFSVTYHE